MRKTRSDKGLIRLTDRDVRILTWIGEQYAVRLDTLRYLLGRDAQQDTQAAGRVTDATARRVVERWRKDDLAQSRKFFFREPEWIWLTSRGLRQMSLDYKLWEPSAGVLNHYHDINTVRLHVENQPSLRGASWRGERSLRRAHWNETGFHIPDGEIHVNNSVIGVEVELTQKSQDRVEDIVVKLDEQYDRVWYFVNEATRSLIEAETSFDSRKFKLYEIADIREKYQD